MQNVQASKYNKKEEKSVRKGVEAAFRLKKALEERRKKNYRSKERRDRCMVCIKMVYSLSGLNPVCLESSLRLKTYLQACYCLRGWRGAKEGDEMVAAGHAYVFHHPYHL